MPARKTRPKKQRERLPRVGVYEDSQGKKLFVPTEEMRIWREAMKPSAVLARAGLDAKQWDAWMKQFGEDHWIFDWLYGWFCGRNGVIPDGMAIVYPSQQPCRNARESEFFMDDEMKKFRRHASLNTTSAYLRKEHPGKGAFFPRVVDWTKQFAEHDWLEGWIRRGADSPPDITVATPKLIRKGNAAWDYPLVCEKLGIVKTTYNEWATRFPVDRLPEWMRWLFGGPPPTGWYVVPEKLIALRDRLTPGGIEKAAGLRSGTVGQWKRTDPHIWSAVEVAIEAAKRGQEPTAKSEAWANALANAQNMRNTLHDRILRYAKCATNKSAFADVGIIDQQWRAHLKKARSIVGAQLEAELASYVMNGESRWGKFGVLATISTDGEPSMGIFAPSDKMLLFRKAAAEIGREHKIISVPRGLSDELFLKWLMDWTIPGGRLGKATRQAIRKSRQPETQKAPEAETKPVPANATPTRKRMGRKPKTELHADIRSFASKHNLWGNPALAFEQLNEDDAFVKKHGRVTKGVIRGVFDRTPKQNKKRPQKS